ncbi:GGDEF domain-containing protein [Marinomonas sp. A79]|uniref:diguanylate cyclase n=1 Tax=Marinomonas vulgaris TaxID=2823372 RepID=A0ABS5HDF9_9GAMM|nr:tetratricopeptide repeat-containing diguanylate cyclase [Marinomonas vulgaris]MBR7889530.1 GGDEF domain-containing protein [Marinomonas vulgaris]
MHYVKSLFPHTIARFAYCFSLLCVLFASSAFANEAEDLLAEMQEAAQAGNLDSIKDALPQLITRSDELTEVAYTDASAKTSLLLRKTAQREAARVAVNYLRSEAATRLQEAVRYRWMMIISYDLMYFSEFSLAKSMIEQELNDIKTWSPSTKDSKTTQANLYHIYGQLLVRQQRVAQALPYFYQAETWFRSIDEQHPSIFVIYILLGEAFLHAREYQQAETFSRKALAMIPDGRVDAISYLNAILASALNRQQRSQEAMKVIADYLANPVDPRRDYFLYFSLVHIDVLRDLKQFDQALALARSTFALAQEVGNEDYIKDATRQLGYMQSYFGNLTEAEILLKEAIESPSGIRQGNPPEAYLDYVDVLMKLGQYDSALAYYRRYHDAFIEEHQRINRIAIANLEFQQRNQRLEQQKALISTQLALAQANEKRAKLQVSFFVWAIFALTVIAATILLMWLQLRRRSQQLQTMAVEDQLTRFGNRHAFLKAFDRPDYYYLLIIDIDGLKPYNDNYGHQKGDELIQTYSEQLRLRFTSSYAALFRTGGDEFAILIDNTTTIDSINDFMFEAVTGTQKGGFHTMNASYGIATREEAHSDREWISLADQRMYAMKKAK